MEHKLYGNNLFQQKRYKESLLAYNDGLKELAVSQSLFDTSLLLVRELRFNRARAFVSLQQWHLAYFELFCMEVFQSMRELTWNQQTLCLRVAAKCLEAHTFMVHFSEFFNSFMINNPQDLDLNQIDKLINWIKTTGIKECSPFFNSFPIDKLEHDVSELQQSLNEWNQSLFQMFSEEDAKTYQSKNDREWNLSSDQAKEKQTRNKLKKLSYRIKPDFSYAKKVLKISSDEAPKLNFDNVSIKHSKIHGLGMFADVNIDKKQIVTKDQAYIAVSCDTSLCDYCLIKLDKNSIKCHCQVVEFCSSKCQELALDDYHKRQCKEKWQVREIKDNIRNRGFSLSSRCAMIMNKILSKSSVFECDNKSFVLKNLTQQIEPLKYFSLNQASGQFSMTAMINQFTTTKTRANLKPRDLVYFEYAIYEYLIMSLMMNTFSIRTGKEDTVPSSCGWYFGSSFINHSCISSCDWTTERNQNQKPSIVLTALSKLEKGNELSITYIGAIFDVDQREEQLYQYGFNCTCDLCRAQRLNKKL